MPVTREGRSRISSARQAYWVQVKQIANSEGVTIREAQQLWKKAREAKETPTAAAEWQTTQHPGGWAGFRLTESGGNGESADDTFWDQVDNVVALARRLGSLDKLQALLNELKRVQI